MSGTMSIGGIASGLKTDDIIAKIMEIARRPQNQMKVQKVENQNKLAAWQDINTRVLALQSMSGQIADAADFQSMTATSSDSDILTATGSTSASPGTYYLKVKSRAQAQQVISQEAGYASINDVVGTGKLSFTLGDDTTFDVELTSANNTLSGLKDAINKANKGVQATIVSTGTAAAPNYRLMLTATTPGTAKQITEVSSTLAGGVAPTFDLLNPVQAAKPAEIQVGDGNLVVFKDSNTITDLIPGVTLNISDADETKTIKVEVTQDTTSIKTAINNFVKYYNDLNDAIDKQMKFDSESGTNEALFGDYELQSVQAELISTISGVVGGISGKYNSIAALGITQDTTGRLNVNDSMLSSALSNSIGDVKKVFSAGLDTDSSYVSFLASTADTKVSGSAGWQVDITQAARRTQVTAGVQMSGTLTRDERLLINGTAVDLTTGMDIDQVIAKINSVSGTTNAAAMKTGADGTGTGNFLTIRSSRYGAAYDVSILGNRLHSEAGQVSTGFGNEEVSRDKTGQGGLASSIAGLDVKGTINGETAYGNGQILAMSDSASTNDAKGISLLITATEPMLTSVKFTKGVGASLRDLLTNMTSANGSVTNAQNSLNAAITDNDKTIASMESRYADQEAALYAKFNAMESQMSKLQSQGSNLAAQLGSLSSGSK